MTVNHDDDHYYNMSLTRISDDVIRKLVNDGVVRACETGDGHTRYEFDEHGLGVVNGFKRAHGCCYYTDPDGYPCSIKPINKHQRDETFIDEDGYVHTTWSLYSYGNFAEIIAESIYDYASPVKEVKKSMINLAKISHEIMDSDYLLYYLPLALVIINATICALYCVLSLLG